MSSAEWITDRPPTEADGDMDGDVRMKWSPDHDTHHVVHWSYVGGAPWQHTSFWQPPAKPAPTEPARIAALERKIAEHTAINPEALTALERRVVELEKVVNQMIKGPNRRRSLGIL